MLGLALAHCSVARADEVAPPSFTAAFQATYVWQAKPAMRSPYAGEHSLDAFREKSYTFSGTAFLGLRLGQGTQLYVNPEVVQGLPLSRLQGLGGLTNGEAQKTAGAKPDFYLARTFVRRTWSLGGERIEVETDKNQFAGALEAKRIVLTAGNFAVNDVFDRGTYSGDPRTQFLNWSFITHGAFDFPADARGYTWGGALEWIHDQWSVRAGRFMLSRLPNEQQLDRALTRHHGDILEIAHDHELANRRGTARLLMFRNHAVMARFDDALAAARGSGLPPDLDAVRREAHSKSGIGLALEQAVTADAGVFARVARADGKSEVYAFAEIDQSASAGALVRGRSWGRADDTVGVAIARNALSASHRLYLAAGGLGFFVGDGRLAYRPESIVEIVYTLALARGVSVSFDWQRVRNPAYNADRGPANLAAVRLHTDF